MNSINVSFINPLIIIAYKFKTRLNHTLLVDKVTKSLETQFLFFIVVNEQRHRIIINYTHRELTDGYDNGYNHQTN